MQEVEDTALFEYLKLFAENMREMRKRLIQTEKLYYNYQKERLFTGIVQFYCETIKIFSINLSGINLKSRWFYCFQGIFK